MNSRNEIDAARAEGYYDGLRHGKQSGPGLTVEDALKELREMFPRRPIRLSIRQDFVLNGASRDPSDTEIYIGHDGDYVYFEDVEIGDCMAQVRQWHKEQS